MENSNSILNIKNTESNMSPRFGHTITKSKIIYIFYYLSSQKQSYFIWRSDRCGR